MDAAGKKKTLQQYLSRGVAMIHLDARRDGVRVPERFKEDAHLRLNLSYRYSIPDFDLDEERVQATLSFGGVPFQCIVPWQAIFGITSHSTGDGQVWPEDLPTEVVRTLAERDDTPVTRGPAGARARPSLVAIECSEGQDRPEKPATEAAKPRGGHLRLVR
jgi:stringent starvation protein B